MSKLTDEIAFLEEGNKKLKLLEVEYEYLQESQETLLGIIYDIAKFNNKQVKFNCTSEICDRNPESAYDGQIARVISPIVDPEEIDLVEVGAMFSIQFSDGVIHQAFVDELEIV